MDLVPGLPVLHGSVASCHHHCCSVCIPKKTHYKALRAVQDLKMTVLLLCLG